MGINLGSLQVRRAKFDSSRMTDLNHWTKQMAIKPHIFEAADRMLFASKTNSLELSKGNILESLYGVTKTVYIDDLEWGWKMNVNSMSPITIIEYRPNPNDADAVAFPGKYRSKFKVLVDNDYGQIGESWGPGSSDKSQVVTIVDKVKEGRNYLYTLQTYTEGAEHFIDPKYLRPGTQWTRLYTMRGEAAESGGWLERGTDIEFKNRLVKLRKEYKVTDFAAQAVLEIAFVDDNGNKHRSWMDMQEADYIRAMNREASYYALYSRIGDTPLIDPDSGYPISPGAGIQQQIQWGGNVEYYNNLSVELIEDFISRVVYSRISPGDLGEIVAFSGYYGMQNFSKALDVWSGGKAVIRESNLIKNDPKGVHNNSLRAGYQYTVYDLPNGGSFRLIYNPLYDDRGLHRDIDPLTGAPLESQRLTILDIRGGDGKSISSDNIKLVRKNKLFGRTLIEGRYGPGGTISNHAKHAGDFYEVHMSDSIGVQITDPTITGELIKAVG